MTAKMTLKIRDPLTSYQPDNKHFVQVNDHRLENKNGRSLMFVPIMTTVII